ncbi:MAG: di-trans,poly-cis-decaprenylcistransferase [Candidatus Moraniibacteriota bacterium]|nr:MAG: di-trans,poly-cis-decaprenylcistransferase [Candidatus Moranbacteria bacterium]
MQEFDPALLPRHVAIIPDGNRRWAVEHGLEPWEGHRRGAKVTEELIKTARDMGICELSFWGSSLENLTKRPLEEKRALLEIYTENFTRLLNSSEIHEDQVRVRCIGRWREQFPESLKALLERGIDTTRGYNKHFLNFFLAYSGDDDMLQAVKTLSASQDEVTEASLKQRLSTAELPPVDLLVRTGGDPHLSTGFMMWETKDAALAFPDCHYPDFGPEAFHQVIENFVAQERRFGR